MNRDMFVAIGACLVVTGFVMRGLARSSRRDQALRKQHDLHAAGSDDPNQPDVIDRHLEKWLPRYATVFITAGFLMIGVALFR